MKFYVNNVESLVGKLHLQKDLKRIKLNPLFSEKRLKDLLKKIPNDFDKETIKKFEKETGIVLKYQVSENKYEFREHTKLGTYPDPKINALVGINYEELMSTYLDNYDILIVINDKKLYLDN